MLDVAWPELIVVGVVALVAVGPEDLPKVMHSMGRLVGRARKAMRVLSDQIDQLDAEAEALRRARAKDEARRASESTAAPSSPPHQEAQTSHDDQRPA